MSTTPTMTARNATLEDLVGVLEDQHARRIDVVAPASAIRAEGGLLVLKGTEHQISEDGVTLVDGAYRPTAVCDEGIADKLGIPLPYLRRMREERPELFDLNVNGWLVRDPRSFLVRGIRGEGGAGVARALLSEGYRFIDNLDVLTAALAGVRAAGVPVRIDGCDLSERRMYVRVVCDAVAVHAPELVGDYRSPYTGAVGTDNPLVFAGFVITNSETGCGAASIVPRVVFQVCNNGVTETRDALRAIHLGAKLDEGIVRWSNQTDRRALDLITAQTTDAVATFLDTAYVTRYLERLQAKAATPVADPEARVADVSKALKFTDEQRKAILADFLQAGDITAGGIMQAVTSVAQRAEADTAYEMEAAATRALELAAA